MSHRTLLCLAAVLLSLGFAPAPFPKRDRPTTPGAVNGTWEFVVWEQNGSASTPTLAYTIEMTREKFDFVRVDGKGRTSYQMRLDPTQSPHAFEWRMGGRVQYVGSYRLDGDRITLVFTSGDRLERRPTQFDGKTPYRFVLRRVKR
jgi:uncharacterized protein (TIGR03067 family)